MADPVEERLEESAAAPVEVVKDAHPTTSYAVRMMLVGHVQGVGFRPFVYRLATEYGLTGYVCNRQGEVEVVVCGRHEVIRRFRADLIRRAPPLSRPRIVKISPVDTAYDSFDIVASSGDAEARVFVPPDYFMCDDCRAELADPGNRRYGYPFINCTQCGPRYTLIESLPYDRPNTSMAGFTLCPECEAEYQTPSDRRFHAEPVACPVCGPKLTFKKPVHSETVEENAALDATLKHLRDGEIVAVKGIGGYHLMCDAHSEAAVEKLRQRKFRPDKPFAVMFPLAGNDGMDIVRQYADLCSEEAELLASPSRPIVLASKKPGTDLAGNIAPNLEELGLFLPYSPLHQLLLDAFGSPLVATSGNVSGEPVLIDNDEAESRLGDVADAFLHHDRPIMRPADDPVYRQIAGHVRPFRIGRGCAPLEMELPYEQPTPLLAVGGHMKGTVALSWENRVVVSPHIGEMDSPRSLDVFERVASELQALYGVTAERIACDAHPGYTTHRWAEEQGLPVDTVWHHHAHASALAAEAAIPGTWLVFTWDGVGLGEDGTLWGGEALLGSAGNWQRVGSLRPFRLPGGERAGREPWRSAAALQWECDNDWAPIADADGIAHSAWESGINCPPTSAAGRLFDAAAALITGNTHVSYEAQGPMQLESLTPHRHHEPVYLSLSHGDDGIWRSDWRPLLRMMTNDSLTEADRAGMFHASMAQIVLQQARRIREKYRINQVGLCGGVFQNRVLTEEAVRKLDEYGFRVFIPEALPCNDAALSFGQAADIAARAA